MVCHMPSIEAAVIDPGGNADDIIGTVLGDSVTVRRILLTHAHHDHVGAVAALCRRFRIACEIHKGDARLLRHAPMYALRFGGKHFEAAEPSNAFDGPWVIQLGLRQINVVHTPGHTAGSVCYDFGGFLFTGDTLLYHHVGRTDLPGGDATLLNRSIQNLLDIFPDDTVLFPGHGRVWTIGEARLWWHEASVLPPQYTQFDA